MMRSAFKLSAAIVLAGTIIAAVTAQAPNTAQPQRPAQAQQPRDTSGQSPSQQAQAVPATGRIMGRVSAADTGRPLRTARVMLSGGQGGGRTAVTDDSGQFDFQQLPEGRYTLNASKAGFVSLSYGQRRPLQPGTPLQLANNQTLRDLELRLPRGSAIGGRITDETGEPMPNIMVRVMRQQLVQGQRQLMPAGSGQTDDRGQYRVWGLNPGEYYVSAVAPNIVLPDPFGRGRGGPGGPPEGRGGRGGPEGRGGRGGPEGRGGRGAALLGLDGLNLQLNGPGGAAAIAQAAERLGATFEQIFPTNFDGTPQQVSYAPTYYPGVSSTRDAQPVNVALASESLGIDFSLLLVRMSRVSGRVSTSDGIAITNGNVNLAPDDQPSGRGGPMAGNYGGRITREGTFVINNVPPGQYVLRARGNTGQPGGRGERGGRGGPNGPAAARGTAPGADTLRFASQPLSVNGDQTDVSVVLSPGATITGTVTLQLTQGTQVDVSQVRITASPADAAIGQETNGRADRNGTFTLQSIPAGPHWFRAQAPRGLILKSVMIGGRDMIDTPHDIQAGEKISGATIVLTDRVSEISGTITDDRGAPVPDYTVLAFPEDARLWGPQSRHIMTTRPDQNGRFQIRGLPAGRYYLVAIDPTNQGEWFEPAFLEQHREASGRLTLAEGEIKTQDFRVPTR
jgi:protocatechuate 3,4-dioxygenase beta subunit